MKKLFYILSLLVATQVVAQTPQAINYQAVATNTSGVAIANTNIGVRISILAGSATGTNVYTETHTATTSANGIFNVEIGRGNVQSGNFPNIQWYAQTHFAKIDIDVNGGTNYQTIGTTQFLSVPYALFAENVAMIFRVDGILYEGFENGTSTIFSNDTLYIDQGRSFTKYSYDGMCDIVDWLGGEPEQITVTTSGFNSNIKIENISFPYVINADDFVNDRDCESYSFSISNTTPVGIYPLTITATNPRGRQKSKTQYVNVLPCNVNTENDFVGLYYGAFSLRINDPVLINIPLVDTLSISNPIINDGFLTVNSKLLGNITCTRNGNNILGNFNNISTNINAVGVFNNIQVSNATGSISGTLCNNKLYLTLSFTSGTATVLGTNYNFTQAIGQEGVFNKQ
jgi:hypothetical protein